LTTRVIISELQAINTTCGEAKRKALVRIDNRGIISELQAINTTWGEAKRKAQDRTRWKETVVALCPPWDEVE
jgi:hypothetical protein